MDIKIENQECAPMTFAEKNHFLYLKQKAMLDTFLAHGAITQAEHDKSLHDLTVKMGEAEISAINEEASVKQALALQYYVQNRASIGYCAKIAGMTEEEFVSFLGQNEISIFRFEDEAELAEDFTNA